MLRVLHHYLPIRKALLILSETLLLTLVLSLWLTAHLWNPTQPVLVALQHYDILGSSRESAIVRCIISAFFLSVLAQLAIAFNELYDVRISGSRFDRASRFVESAGSALGLTLLAVVLVHSWKLKYVLDIPPLSLSQRVQTLVFAMLSGFALLYYWRTFFHYFLRKSSFSERVLIFGGGKAAHFLAREMRERPDTGFDIVGILPDSTSAPERQRPAGGQLFALRRTWTESERRAGAVTLRAVAVEGAQSASAIEGAVSALLAREPAELDSTQDLLLKPLPHPGAATLYEYVKEHNIDVLVVALEDRRNNLPTDELLRCRLAGIPVREQEAVYEEITGKIAVEALRPSYLIFNEGFSRHPWNELAKRSVDVVCASVILFFTWPLMLATAIAVRLDSSGPILFSQERVGRDGELFTLLKFRSMRADAEKISGPVWATQDDPRITRPGRFIRRTRLDELPQLFNVLAGHMSMVGPRPERAHFVDELAGKIPYYRQRHIVKPGLTGWAQINYRYGSTLEDALQKLQYDLFYIKNQSLLFDLSILFNTVKIVILRKGT